MTSFMQHAVSRAGPLQNTPRQYIKRAQHNFKIRQRDFRDDERVVPASKRGIIVFMGLRDQR
jgi:hypothetical protein